MATGTATWLMDAANDFPIAQLDGFDNSLNQAPSTQWLPPHMTLRTCDIFEDVLIDLLATYGVIPVRLHVLVAENSDPRPVARELVAMIKPGGCLH